VLQRLWRGKVNGLSEHCPGALDGRVQGERQGSWVATGSPPRAGAMLATGGIDRAQRMISDLTTEVGS